MRWLHSQPSSTQAWYRHRAGATGCSNRCAITPSKRAETTSTLGGGTRRYFTDVAEAAEPSLSGPEQVKWLARLDQEHDNLRAALDRLGELCEPLAELRLAAALGRFWYLRGHIAEGMERLGSALERNRGLVDPLTAKALRVRSALAVIQGEYIIARELAEAALSHYRALADDAGRCENAQQPRRDPPRARRPRGSGIDPRRVHRALRHAR